MSNPETVRSRLWMILIFAGVLLQLGIAGILLFGGNSAKQSRGASQPNAGQTEAPEISDQERNRYTNLLLQAKDIDVSDWHVAPEFLNILEQRKSPRLTSFIAGPCVNDDNFSLISHLQINSLDLRDAHITAAAIDALAQMKDIEELKLESIAMSGRESIKKIALLPKLKRLTAIDCSLTDDSMQAFSQHALIYLNLDRNTGIGDRGVSRLSPRQSQLTTLSLGETSITDAGVADLARLQSLEELHLQGDKITDSAIPSLAKLRHLRVLDVSSTEITDAGFADFRPASPQLKKVVIRHCRTTLRSVQLIKDHIPGCWVVTEASANGL